MKKSNITRRDFVINGTSLSLLFGASPLISPNHLFGNQSAPSKPPKFMLNILYSGGLSQNYLFDSRPAEFTGAGIFVNNVMNKNITMRTNLTQTMRGRTPYKITDAKSRYTYVNPIVDPILKGTDSSDPNTNHLAIINGVYMNLGEDLDHTTNLTRTLSGTNNQDFFFFQKVNDLRGQALLLYQEQTLAGLLGPKFITNPVQFDKILDLSKNSMVNSQNDSSLVSHVEQTYSNYAQAAGSLKMGSRELSVALQQAKELQITLQKTSKTSNSGNSARPLISDFSVNDLMTMIRYNFEFGVSQFATLVIDADVDSHGVEDSIQDPDTYANISTEISEIFEYLNKNDFISTKTKMRDEVLTMVSSEFNRTTFSETREASIYSSGTDHNPFGNTVLLYGGGIKGLQIIGQTDGQQLTQTAPNNWDMPTFGNLGTADFKFDENIRKMHAGRADSRQLIGRAFDFSNQQVIENYTNNDLKDFITINHVHNSILRHFGIKDQDLNGLAAGGTARDYLLNLT